MTETFEIPEKYNPAQHSLFDLSCHAFVDENRFVEIKHYIVLMQQYSKINLFIFGSYKFCGAEVSFL